MKSQRCEVQFEFKLLRGQHHPNRKKTNEKWRSAEEQRKGHHAQPQADGNTDLVLSAMGSLCGFNQRTDMANV